MPPSPIASSIVSSHNEWDPLEEVLVGSVQGSVYPPFEPVLAAGFEPSWLWHFQGAFVEEDLVERATEQLDTFVEILTDSGVTVRRPSPIPHNLPFSSPFWSSKSGWNSANPRDLLMVLGDLILEAASPLQHRQFEAQAYQPLIKEYFRHGARWISAPRPSLRSPLYNHAHLNQAISNNPSISPPPPPKDALSPNEPHHYPITEYEPVFETADFIRCGRDLFVTQSNVTNALGIEWVRRHIGPQYTLHTIDTRCPHPCHIDTTFIPLAPGKALVHPLWISHLPDCLSSWDLIVAPPPEYSEDSPMHDPHFTSQWLSMNVFSLDPKHVFVDDQQTQLIRLLESHNFEPIPIPFDCVGAFGGSFHCATLDIRRRGTLERYVDGS